MYFSALLGALLVPLVAAGMYREPAIELDAKSFKSVMAKEHASMVAFVAPWCGHCKNLAPEYSAAATSLSPLIPFYYVDCDADKNKPLCAQYGIEGFPTLKAFPRGAKGSARDYRGERKRSGLVEYAKTLVPDRVRKLRIDDGGVDKTLTKFLDEKTELPHALLVHPSAPSIPFLWKVLGHRLSGKAALGYIRDTLKHELLIGLNAYDASAGGDSARLVFWKAGADRDDVMVYDGALKFNALLEWLEAVIAGEEPPAVEKPKKEKETKEKRTKEKETKETEEAKQEVKGKPKAAETEDAAARRARLQAKLDEAERRDRLRREKLAKKAEEDATPVEPPAAEPEEDADDEDAPLTVEVEPEEPTAAADGEVSDDGTPVDAPPAEPQLEEHTRDEL